MNRMIEPGSAVGPERLRTVMVATAACIAVLGLAGCERWALDRQMEELCKKDGGVRVYETVTLPASEFSNVGQPLAKYERLAKSPEERLGPGYRYVERRATVAGHAGAKPERGEGRLLRVHQAVFRRSDQKLLGECVWYERGGGDFLTFGFQPSSDYCPKPRVNLIGAIFLKGE